MANQTPKTILAAQAKLPKTAFGGTPLASLGEGASGILTSIANVLPEMPTMPAGLPSFPAGTLVGNSQFPQPPMVTEFIKGIEASLPIGLPKPGLPGAQVVSDVVLPAPPKAPDLIFE